MPVDLQGETLQGWQSLELYLNFKIQLRYQAIWWSWNPKSLFV